MTHEDKEPIDNILYAAACGIKNTKIVTEEDKQLLLKEQKSINLHDKIEELCSKYPINKHSMSDEELSAYHQGVHLGATKIAEYLSEQKTVGLSEEDEDMIDTIIRDLKFLGGDIVNVSPAYKEEVNWLKSLYKRLL